MTDELNERFSPKQIKQAIGIASDKRYAGGNMTGATKTIEKLARGLSDHPQVRAVLKRQNEDVNEKFDPADLDMVATDKDKAGAKMNIIMQLRKAADVKGNMPIQFADGKKAKLPPKVIELALKKFASFRKPDSKEKLQTAMGKSYKDMVHALKTMREEVELDEAMFMVTVAKGGPGGKDLNVKVNAKNRMDAAKVFRKSNPRYKNDEISIKESIEEGVDKAKIQKQIDQAEKYLKTFFGNTSSVKMKKVAIQRKIDKLKKQLNEAEEDGEVLEEKFVVKYSMSKRGTIRTMPFNLLVFAKKFLADKEKEGYKGIISKNGKVVKEDAEEDYCDCGCECGKEICESCGKPHKPENIDESKMAGWIAFYNGKKVEIKKSEANDLYGAKMKAAKMLKVPKSKMGLLAIKPGYNEEVVNEEVQQDLQEAPNYKLYHNTFSAAVQEAIAVAKKKGFDVDEDDWHDKVATGPKKPSKDKTNSYSIKLMKKGKPVRQMLQIQVYNMGAKYELNCYVQ